MDALVSAAHACAAEITRRSNDRPAELAPAVRPMVDGDLCASPDDQASGAQLSRWWRWQAGMNVVGDSGPDGGFIMPSWIAERIKRAAERGERLVGEPAKVAMTSDGARYAECGCGFEAKSGATVHHHCAAHSSNHAGSGFSESWNGRAR